MSSPGSVKFEDVLGFAVTSTLGHRTRSVLLIIAVAIGVASVVTLTALGEGARRFVTGEFEALGTHLLIVLPGRSETVGGPPPLLGETPRDLTLDDALALARHPTVRRVAPVSVGQAAVSYRERDREVLIIGTTPEFLEVRRLMLARGRFLPAGDPRRAAPVVVLGRKIARELFANESPLGRWVRIGDRRFRVVGILASEGRSIGLDVDDMAIVPVASAQALFDTPSLFRVLVEARSGADVTRAQAAVRRIVRQRHEGEDDVTVITQDAVVGTFDRIFRALTYTVGGVAAVSLGVAGILIMNVMLVAVAQRTAEIGLLKALGARRRTIMALFLAEATILALAGAATGAACGLAAVHVTITFYPALPLSVPDWALAAGVGVALLTAVVFGVLPARRAAALDPVNALSQR